MNKWKDEFRSYRQVDRPLLSICVTILVLVGMMLLGMAMAQKGYVTAACPFLFVFIAVGLLAYIREPRKW